MENLINDYFEITIKDRIATINIKKDVFKLIKSEDSTNLLINSLKLIQRDPNIKALLFINTLESFGEKHYDDFIEESIISFNKNKPEENLDFPDCNERFKEYRILNKFIKYLTKYNKLCFIVLSGGIVTPFFSASLAIDLRYATPDMHFILAHNKYGLHPSGGLPHFLIKQVGYNKAIELMLSEKISAEKALNLGLINKIVPVDNMLENVIKDIKRIIKLPSCTLRRTKRLSNYVRDSLDDYYDFEASLWNL